MGEGDAGNADVSKLRDALFLDRPPPVGWHPEVKSKHGYVLLYTGPCPVCGGTARAINTRVPKSLDAWCLDSDCPTEKIIDALVKQAEYRGEIEDGEDAGP